MDFVHGVTVYLIMAALVQFITDRFKEIFPGLTLKLTPPFCSCILGVLLSLAYGLDFFEALGCSTQWAYVPRVLTGVFISAGADPLHNLLAKLRVSRSDI